MDPIFEKNLIPTKEAAELSGYTSDYLARLARSKKISARRVGHTWFVDSESLKSFLDQQGDRKIDYARALARSREAEYRALHSTLQQVTNTLTKPLQMPEKLGVVARALRSHALAVSLSFAVVVFGAFGARAEAIPLLANQIAEIVHDAAYGFGETFGDIPSHIAARIKKTDTDTHARVPRIALIASPILIDFNISRLPMTIDTNHELRTAPFQSTIPSLNAPVTFENVQTAARDAYTFITHPSRIADSLARAYIAIGVDTYAAITASLSAYRSLIEASGIQSLALAAAARDALATAPRLVAEMNLAFGTAIISASHAAIQADTMLAYGLAEAAPRSARATVALIGFFGLKLLKKV